MTLPWHPLANLFPLIEGADYAAFVADVREHGLRDAIIIHDGMILDGRNRARACEDAQVAPRYEPFAGGDEQALGLVLSKNLTRRHLDDGQRAYVAAKLANIGWGGDRSKTPNGGLTIAQAAERLKVAKRTVDRAKIVHDRAAVEVQELVERGELPVALAAGIAGLDEAEQHSLMSEARGAKGPIARRALTLLKQRMRTAREKQMGERQIAAPQGVFGLIVEDFEWDHETWSAAGKDSRHPSNHYQTSADAHTAEEIVRRTARRFACAAENCILWQWATIPHLAIAIDVMRMRGFDYRSHYIWRKDRIITGYWSRARHEILLIGVKGHIDCPAQGTQLDSVIDATIGRHSVKPDAIMEMIERYYPTLPKLELNARVRRPGWQAWGNEIDPAPEWRIACERKAIARGLINGGMVRTSATAVVAFDFVTAEEWQALLATPACDEPFDPKTGEIVTVTSPDAQVMTLPDSNHSAILNSNTNPDAHRPGIGEPAVTGDSPCAVAAGSVIQDDDADDLRTFAGGRFWRGGEEMRK